MSEYEGDWRARAEEARLISEYRGARSARRTGGWLVGGAILGGLILASASALFLLLAGALAMVGYTTRRRADEKAWSFLGSLNELRTFPNPEEPMHGDLISMAPDPLGMSSVRLVGRVLDGDEHGGTAVVLSEPADGSEFVSKVEGSFFLRRDELAVYAMEDGQALIYDRVEADVYAERWAPLGGMPGSPLPMKGEPSNDRGAWA